MRNGAAPVVLAGSDLGDTRHVCAFFRSDDEEYATLLPFIRDGFAVGDRAIHVVSPDHRDDHLRRLAAAGIDTAAAGARGQLELRDSTDLYLRHGWFDQDRMLATFEQLASGNGDGRFARSRVVCRMDWVAGSGESVDSVIEFESRVNDVWRRHDDVVVCTYRMDQFRGDAVIDVLRTHPIAIIGGMLQRNPFFVPPEQFVQEIRARRTATRARHATGA